MNYNEQLKDTGIALRKSLIVYLRRAQDQYKLRREGDVVYFSKKEKYSVIYVDATKADSILEWLNRQSFVVKAEFSPANDLDFSPEHETNMIKKMAEEAEKILEENGDIKA